MRQESRQGGGEKVNTRRSAMVIMKASTKLETPSLLISSRPHVRGLHPHIEDIPILETKDSVIFTSLGMFYVQVQRRGWIPAEIPNIDST